MAPARRRAGSALSDPPLTGLPPVVGRHTRTLIVGSFPGVASLAAQQYYGHPRNHFWRLVGDVIGEDLARMDYPARLQALLEHRIGLWDAVAKAHRRGSLDGDIRGHTTNDLAGLVQDLPELAAIAFNGATAARIGMKQLARHAERYRVFRLPSSSPAYTLPFAEKLAAWKVLEEAPALPGKVGSGR